MPFANGHIYRTSVLGVSVDDVANALNTTGIGDIGTLCTHPNINKWAKFKPESRPQFDDLTSVQRKADKYGLTVSSQTSTTPNLLPNYYVQSDGGWSYTPRTEYYRLHDFYNIESLTQGYYPAALSPITQYTPTSTWRYTEGSKIQFAAIGNINNNEEIGLGDIAEILGSNTLYFGVALTNNNGNWIVATASSPVSMGTQGYNGLVVDIEHFGYESAVIGTWTVIPFFSLAQIPQWSSWGGTAVSTTFYPCPSMSTSSLDIQSSTSNYTVKFEGFKHDSVEDITGTLSIKNNSSAPLELDVILWIWDSSIPGKPIGPDSRPREGYEIQRDKGTITLPANSDFVQVDTFTFGKLALTEQLYNNAVVYIAVESALYGPEYFYRESPTEE